MTDLFVSFCRACLLVRSDLIWTKARNPHIPLAFCDAMLELGSFASPKSDSIPKQNTHQDAAGHPLLQVCLTFCVGQAGMQRSPRFRWSHLQSAEASKEKTDTQSQSFLNKNSVAEPRVEQPTSSTSSSSCSLGSISRTRSCSFFLLSTCRNNYYKIVAYKVGSKRITCIHCPLPEDLQDSVSLQAQGCLGLCLERQYCWPWWRWVVWKKLLLSQQCRSLSD